MEFQDCRNRQGNDSGGAWKHLPQKMTHVMALILILSGSSIAALAGAVVDAVSHAVLVEASGVCVNGNIQCDPSQAVGTPDFVPGGGVEVVSLGGSGGFITAHFAIPLGNGTGPDLRVFEIGEYFGIHIGEDEPFDVYISEDGVSWIQIANDIMNDPGVPYASVDFGSHQGAYSFVRVVDDRTELWHGSTAGADIDALEGLFVSFPSDDPDDRKQHESLAEPRLRILGTERLDNGIVRILVKNVGTMACSGCLDVSVGLSYNTMWIPEWETIFHREGFGSVTLAPGATHSIEFLLSSAPESAIAALERRLVGMWRGYRDVDAEMDYLGIVLGIGEQDAVGFLPLED